jgi:tetratricopeptide (TPR) repeat protein
MIKLNLLIANFLILLSCDFTPQLNKDILRAQVSIDLREYKQAAYQYEEILKKHSSKDIRIKIAYQLAEIYSIYLSEYSKAIFYYNNVIELSQDPLWTIKSEEKIADILFSFNKDYKSSAFHYKRLVDFTPKLERFDLYEFRYAISLIYFNKDERGVDLLFKINSTPTHEFKQRSLYYVGEYYYLKEDWVKAVYYWKNYIENEPRQDNIVKTKFLMANAYEMMESLKIAYDTYRSILNDYPNREVIKNRLSSIYDRRLARKR